MMILRVSLVCLALASAAYAVSLNKRETAQKAPEARADYSPPSYGGGGGGGGAAHSAGGYGGDQGNLYYYYYPVQEHAGYQTTAGREDDFSGLLGLLLPLFVICCCCILVMSLFSGGGTVISAGSTSMGRKKRNDEEPPYRDSILELRSELNRLFFLYLNAVESEQCPERIFCEVGTYAGSFSWKDIVFRMIDTFDIVPDAFKSKFRVMEKAALTGKDMSICKKYLCHPPKLNKRN